MDGNDPKHRRLPGRPRHHHIWRPLEPRLVAEPAEPADPAPEHRAVEPDGRGLRLRRGVQEARPRRGQDRPHRADDRQPGLVAGRLRPLRRVVHPHGLALGRHLPHRRRPRRRLDRQPALRAAQLLARQRQPRQGPPPALADQAEIRQQPLLGRPDDPGRQRRAGIDGLQDLRLRRRPRRHLGARGRHLLGRRGRMARRPPTRQQPLLRRPRARKPAGRRADGPDLRQPRRPRRQSRPARLGPRHPRDLRAHGDERRGNRRADRRRPHLRQDAWRRRRRACRPRAGSRAARGDGLRLAIDATAPARAATPSPPASKAPGRRTRPRGTWAISTCCSATSGS